MLDGLVRAAAGGRSGALVQRGEPGIGRTALLDHAGGLSGHVLRHACAEAEAALPYAGLEPLLRPLTHLAERLPDPQREALGAACAPP
ncbi:hypothetical protein [Streptomyces sp. NPDC052107]|uniref:hypothetical protein n=1 Tax=Streptomyces sp. NPDC052107 TaxID=3155632 RepID=UPI00341A5AFF